MVAAANPLAADAGYRMLKQGGGAIDAAIATQLVLTLVEPQSSGIGGGAFLLYADGKQVQAFDGRETAPAAADETLFQNPDGRPVSRATGVVGGRSVGAPGVLRMLELAHQEHGKLAWATLFGPAIALAQDGFPVSQRLNGLLKWDQALKRDPVAAAYFYDSDGQPWPVGHVLKNPALARTLREIAAGGADAFYKGRIARDIAAKVAAHPTNPGKLTAHDIAAYQAKVRAPVCSDYKAWTVCGMPPPSSGGIAIAQMLGMLETKDIGAYPTGRRRARRARDPPVCRSGPPGVCRPQPLCGRYRLRAAAGRRHRLPARQRLSGAARRADRRALDGPRRGRHAARHAGGVGPGQRPAAPVDLAPGRRSMRSAAACR